LALNVAARRNAGMQQLDRAAGRALAPQATDIFRDSE
jgi:hypothetical protein